MSLTQDCPALPQDPAPQPRVQSRNEEHARAIYATLLDRPASGVAVSLCEELLDGLLRDKQKRNPRAKQRVAFGALIADLLHRDPADNGGWLYRSLRPEGFTGEAIGYRVFRPIVEAMDGTMLEVVTGRQFWTKTELTGGKWQIANQQATRFRATDHLRQLFEDQGINHANWSEHFERDSGAVEKAQGKRPVSVILRGGKPPRSTGVTKGHPLPIDLKDPVVSAMVSRMDKLNDYLSSQRIEPYGPTVQLKRIFSEGDKPDHDWRQGGRLYTPGRESYQNAKKEARKAISINGDPTVELDIQSSHLTLLVGLGHLPVECLDSDPYAVEGIPRSVVKQWVTMTMSHGKRHLRWPKDASDELLSKHGIDVKKDYPIGRTGDTILEKLALIQSDGRSVPAGWGELQFLESEIMLACMETLAFDHDVPSLTVHDSLIVPVEAESLARATLQEKFKEMLGVMPEVMA